MHLTFADTLYQQYKQEGNHHFRLATALQDCLLDRQTAVMKNLPKLQLPAALRDWQLIILMKATKDWRHGHEIAQPSNLLAMQTYYSMKISWLNNPAYAYLDKHANPSSPMWRHLVLSNNFTVGLGHRWASGAIKEIMGLINSVCSEYGTSIGDIDDLCTLLNDSQNGMIVSDNPQDHYVLGKSMWPYYLQRMLCISIVGEHTFYEDKLAHHDTGDEIEEFAESQLQELKMHPYLMLTINSDLDNYKKWKPRFCKDYANNWLDLPLGIYVDLLSDYKRKKMSGNTPDLTWLYENFITNTAFQARDRIVMNFKYRSKSHDLLDEINIIAPYEYSTLFYRNVLNRKISKSGKKTAETFDKITDYHLEANRKILADCDLVSERNLYEETAKRMCMMDANYFVRLAIFYRQLERFDESIVATEKFIRLCSDRVKVSNNLDWAATHLWHNGQKIRAFEMANIAYGTRSSAGYLILSRLHELEGNLEQAEQLLLDQVSHYDNYYFLTLFYQRTKNTEKLKTGGVKKVMGNFFPDGFIKFEIPDPVVAPNFGQEITYGSQCTVRHGVKKGDVIVALDGIKVVYDGHLKFLRWLSLGSQAEYTLWDGEKYYTKNVQLPNRKWGVGLKNFKKDE
ncbi:MAG: hypothetical protein HRU15_17075 [Planctomycetes bacterium]|nr:hypothetical protein [Planctomycetota bacterium]